MGDPLPKRTRRCVMQAICLWPLWQAILVPIAVGFTRRGQQRFVEWVTGLALNVEEHTITQSLIGLGRVPDWKALESFAEYGRWDLPFLQWGGPRRPPVTAGTRTSSTRAMPMIWSSWWTPIHVMTGCCGR